MHLVPLLLVKHVTNQISDQIEELVFSISIAHGVRGAQESWSHGVMEVSAMGCAHRAAGEKGSWQRIADIFMKRHGTVRVICNVATSGLTQGSFLNFCFSYGTCIGSPLELVSWESYH